MYIYIYIYMNIQYMCMYMCVCIYTHTHIYTTNISIPQTFQITFEGLIWGSVFQTKNCNLLVGPKLMSLTSK